MKRYIGTKIVHAEPCTLAEFITKTGKIPTESKEDSSMTKGYLVKYNDGYVSWSPEAPFEEAYRECDSMSFGLALECLKKGMKVTRKGWNGKGMFLWLKPATIIEESWCKDPLLKQLAIENGGTIPALGTICMYTHDSTKRKAILTGWLASQTDMLSDDWELVD